MKQITIKQHYVPQVLLRGFSDANEKINIYDLSQKVIRCQSIKEVFFQNYFYDKDNQVEDNHCQIESDAAEYINKLRLEDYSILYQGKKLLLRFALLQSARTNLSKINSLNQAENIISSFIKKIILEKFGEQDNGDYGKFSFSKDFAREIISKKSATSVLVSEFINDLSIHLLINDTSQDFIISDHPGVAYNWYLQNSDSLVALSPFAIGTQFFLPLSTKLYLCFFDSGIYKYGQLRNSCVSRVSNLNDINWLNQLQIRSTFKMIAFKNYNSSHYIQTLFNNTNSKLVEEFFDENKKYIMTGKRILSNLSKPDFFKILKKPRTGQSLIREPEQFIKCENFFKLLADPQFKKTILSNRPNKS